jgi:beta-galactosidase
MNLMKANAKYLANAFPKFDNIKFGFIPDYYMTEFHYPNSQKQRHLHDEIKLIRDNGALNITARSLILGNRSFDCVNLQDENVNEQIANDVLIVNSARYMHKEIQERIIKHIENGNNILIYGFLPEYDMEGNVCTLLKDYLNVSEINDFRDLKYPVMSVYPDSRFNHHYEVRCGIGQTIDVSNIDAEVILREYETKDACGYIKEYGKAKVCVITCYYHCNLKFFDELYNYLGCSQIVKYQPKFYGTYSNLMVNEYDEGYINIFTLDGYKKEEDLFINGNKIFKNKITLEHKKCAMLPYNLKINENIIIKKANAEIIDINNKSIVFRPIQKLTEIYLIKDNEEILLEYEQLENIILNI